MSGKKLRIENDKLIMKQSANNLTEAIITYLNLNGHFVWRQNNAGIYDPTKKIFRKNKKQKKGVADVCGITKTGIGLYVEVKTTDKLSNDQKLFKAEILRRNGIYIEARSIDDVINFSLL
ncbi:MAG: VRR-NUC domain-containing protein [Melioribacteraceae bacterium]|nr:VRR-NUC domain-containing protein [Melioribacteraceae bacterium]